MSDVPPAVDELHGFHGEDGGDDVVRVVSPPSDLHQPLPAPADKDQPALKHTDVIVLP